MKDLTIEQKAKRYDEAKYIMKEYLESGNAGIIAENTIKKAFPELAESEDEKIRKALMQNLKERFGTKGNMGEGLDMPDVLAWLEKQGEHANFRNKIQVGDKVTRNEAGVLVNISQLNRIAKPRKQGEQKSVEWSEEDLSEFESYLCLMFQKFRTKGVCTNGEIVGFVKEHSQKLKDTLCHAWSEEDNKHLERILKELENQRQRPANRLYLEEIESDYKWLKSLRPQVTWKPSEEQMGVIEAVINNRSFQRRHLDSLYEQLKKLRGE